MLAGFGAEYFAHDVSCAVDDEMCVGEIRLGIDVTGDTQHALNFLQIAGNVSKPDLTNQSVELVQTAPGSYEATVDGAPYLSSPDSGSFSLRETRLVTNSLMTGVLQYATSGDTLWIGAVPGEEGAGYLVRER